MSKKKESKDPKKEKLDAEAAEKAAVNEAVEELVASIENGENSTEGSSDENEPPKEETIDDVKAELTQANERYLRLMAEFDNYKKRTTREYQKMVETANEKIVGAMTEVRNTFILAIKHGETSTDYEKLFDGVKLIFNKFDGVLTSHGLTSFAEVGEPFDPQKHDALMKTPHAEILEDHIVEIYEKGYCLNERIIKHAKVIVSSGKPAAEGSNESSPAE